MKPPLHGRAIIDTPLLTVHHPRMTERAILDTPLLTLPHPRMTERAILDTPLLTLPHPRMTERAFVATPLAEIAPGLLHPVLRENAYTLAASLPDRAFMVCIGPSQEPLPA